MLKKVLVDLQNMQILLKSHVNFLTKDKSTWPHLEQPKSASGVLILLLLLFSQLPHLQPGTNVINTCGFCEVNFFILTNMKKI